MVADIRQAPQKWTFILPNGEFSDGVAMVLAMLRQLHDGQKRRHGGDLSVRSTPKRRLGPQSTSL